MRKFSIMANNDEGTEWEITELSSGRFVIVNTKKESFVSMQSKVSKCESIYDVINLFHK